MIIRHDKLKSVAVFVYRYISTNENIHKWEMIFSY